jgi:hypothetical protein
MLDGLRPQTAAAPGTPPPPHRARCAGEAAASGVARALGVWRPGLGERGPCVWGLAAGAQRGDSPAAARWGRPRQSIGGGGGAGGGGAARAPLRARVCAFALWWGESVPLAALGARGKVRQPRGAASSSETGPVGRRGACCVGAGDACGRRGPRQKGICFLARPPWGRRGMRTQNREAGHVRGPAAGGAAGGRAAAATAAGGAPTGAAPHSGPRGLPRRPAARAPRPRPLGGARGAARAPGVRAGGPRDQWASGAGTLGGQLGPLPRTVPFGGPTLSGRKHRHGRARGRRGAGATAGRRGGRAPPAMGGRPRWGNAKRGAAARAGRPRHRASCHAGRGARARAGARGGAALLEGHVPGRTWFGQT